MDEQDKQDGKSHLQFNDQSVDLCLSSPAPLLDGITTAFFHIFFMNMSARYSERILAAYRLTPDEQGMRFNVGLE